MNEITTKFGLLEFASRKTAFLSNPGCFPNLEELEDDLGYEKVGVPEERLLSEWFDATVEELSNIAEFVIHRHLSVADFDAFMAAIEEGDADVGAHWSTSPETWSDHCDALGTDVVLTGRVAASQVDWLTTFQTRLVFPWEREIAFEGRVALDLVRRLDDGAEWQAGGVLVAAGEAEVTWSGDAPHH